MRIIKTGGAEFKDYLTRVKERGGAADEKILTVVKTIVTDVATHGDRALFAYTQKFDGYNLTAENVKVAEQEIIAAAEQVQRNDMAALKTAADRIRSFHERQSLRSWCYSDESGIELGQHIRPLERIGIYAPGGRALYPSTALMAAIPAKVAGVKEIILVTPTRGGSLHPLIAAAVEIAGIDSVYKIGGAQAIAALAYGTESVPKVDKIVGPGNAYVAAAKQMIFGLVGIDMIAGPSEVIIICDGRTDPAFAAADMLAQAEHDPLAAAILLTPDQSFAEDVSAEIECRLKSFARAAIAEDALRNFGAVLITKNLLEAVDIANQLAPEHLELMLEDPKPLMERIKNAGAVLMGRHTPAAVGDYLAGPNHILPTNGTARFSSPLGVYDFVKRTSVVSFTNEALHKYSEETIRLAELEGLEGHGQSISTRMQRK